MGCGASAAGGQYANLSEDTRKIGDDYELDKRTKLGEGADGTVCRGRSIATGSFCAVKIVPNKSLTVKHQEEISIMKDMQHPNIISLYDDFKDRRNTYIVMELCSGGELFDRIMGKSACQERQVEMVMRQIIPAVGYMHAKNICHRDLKPENLMLMNQDSFEVNQIKIIDFGLAKRFGHGQPFTSVVGSPFYVAPQVLAGRYDHLSDMWSCGVIMYLMLCGIPPFTGETDDEVLDKVKMGRFVFDEELWKEVSQDARILIRCLLKMKPTERYSAEQAMAHAWLTRKAV